MSLFEKEGFKSFALALIFLGLIILIAGAAFYVIYSLQIEQNPAYRIQQTQEQIPAEVAQTLVTPTMQLREQVRTREYGLVAAGVGTVILALGWMGREYSAFRKAKARRR